MIASLMTEGTPTLVETQTGYYIRLYSDMYRIRQEDYYLLDFIINKLPSDVQVNFTTAGEDTKLNIQSVWYRDNKVSIEFVKEVIGTVKEIETDGNILLNIQNNRGDLIGIFHKSIETIIREKLYYSVSGFVLNFKDKRYFIVTDAYIVS